MDSKRLSDEKKTKKRRHERDKKMKKSGTKMTIRNVKYVFFAIDKCAVIRKREVQRRLCEKILYLKNY